MILVQLYFKQSSTTQSKCLPQLYYAHSKGKTQGTERILHLLVVPKTDMTFSLGRVGIFRGRKLMCPSRMFALW
jgi:hypothetical protein